MTTGTPPTYLTTAICVQCVSAVALLGFLEDYGRMCCTPVCVTLRLETDTVIEQDGATTPATMLVQGSS